MRNTAVLCLLVTGAFGQVQPNNPEPTNIDFSQGVTGQMPFGWQMSQAVSDAGYRAELRDEGCGGKLVFALPMWLRR